MCGIAGALSLGPELGGRDRKAVEAMTAALDHRGPDARGLLVEPLALLGNTRLKITDLSEAAALPMSGFDDGVWIAYNGAVTNFRELVETFGLDRRMPLRSGSDAEVVLRLYETLGIDALRHLSGMFAFCIYDARRRKAYLVRDFYGQRPVFYRVKGGRLHFASEIKAFLELPDFDKRLDYEALHHYFSLAYIPGKHTPFAELRELEGGHYLEIDLGTSRVQERVYHRLRYETDEERGEKETAAELRELLLDSVRRSMDVDVPVGLMLSGGVDTGGILAMIKHLGLSRKLHTFSV
ncbi:MAG: asparagine synthetase B, partial [Elusimicrobiota bacterium]